MLGLFLPHLKNSPLLLGNYFPFLVSAIEPASRYIVLGIKHKTQSREEIFTKIYKKHYWGGHSRSGPGSDLSQTKTIRNQLPKVFRNLGVSSVLDAPCGDHHWAKEMNLDFLDYTGVDIVQDIIETNIKKYAQTKKKFVHLDICKDNLPKADLILCRDLMQHLSYEEIWKATANITKTKSKYLLASSQLDTQKNRDITTGGWRRLNLMIPPFCFPEPKMIIDEEWNNKTHGDRALLLWDLESIRQHFF